MAGLKARSPVLGFRDGIAGVVRDSDERPVGGVKLKLVFSDGSTKAVTSGEDGSWSVADAPPGGYQVFVEDAGVCIREAQAGGQSDQGQDESLPAAFQTEGVRKASGKG